MAEQAQNRWLAENRLSAAAYDAPYAERQAAGEDMHGEANLVAELVPPGSILDAGCGTGRVGIELARRGYAVVGVDIDPEMLAEARRKAPDLDWREGDIATIQLHQQFNGIVMAGNVMIFLTPGTAGAVVANMARHLTPGGLLIAGFQLGTPYLTLDAYEQATRRAGLRANSRWRTWDREPWQANASYGVWVHRRPPPPGG